MDLNGKNIKITSSSVTTYPPSTTVSVELISDSQVSGVKVVTGRYELTFEDSYGGPGDPRLQADIVEKLTALPS